MILGSGVFTYFNIFEVNIKNLRTVKIIIHVSSM